MIPKEVKAEKPVPVFQAGDPNNGNSIRIWTFAVFRGKCKDSPQGKGTQIYPQLQKGLKISLRSSGTIPGLLKTFLSHIWAGGNSSATPPILPLLTEFI